MQLIQHIIAFLSSHKLSVRAPLGSFGEIDQVVFCCLLQKHVVFYAIELLALYMHISLYYQTIIFR